MKPSVSMRVTEKELETLALSKNMTAFILLLARQHRYLGLPGQAFVPTKGFFETPFGKFVSLDWPVMKDVHTDVLIRLKERGLLDWTVPSASTFKVRLTSYGWDVVDTLEDKQKEMDEKLTKIATELLADIEREEKKLVEKKRQEQELEPFRRFGLIDL